MNPLPPPLGPGTFVIWRLDQAGFASTWDSGEGSYRVGGRWNSRGVRAVYTSLDPATAILEVAVHKTFAVLDVVAHTLTSASINDAADIHVVEPCDVPDPDWLCPGIPTIDQQAFGDALLRAHPFVALPSTVSRYSWNVVFDPAVARGLYSLDAQERFALDTRLNPS